MPLQRIIGIHRGIAISLLVLTLAAAARRAEAQPPVPSQQQLAREIAGAREVAGLLSPPTTAADDAAEKAWAKIGPPLKRVDYPQLPLSEVIQVLQNSFSNQFDVIADKEEASDITISLRLQDVSAAEEFNAMNLYFETGASSRNRKPHWKLILNGSRPTAVLEISQNGPPERAPQSSVFYIGDLLPDAAGIGFTPDKLFKAIREVHDDTGAETAPRLAFHPDAGLLVVTGTLDQGNLTQATLNALQQKVGHDRQPAYPLPRPFPSIVPPPSSLQHLNQPGPNPPAAAPGNVPPPPPPGNTNLQ